MNHRFLSIFWLSLISFSIYAQPVIQSFSPLSGPIGSQVTINPGLQPQDIGSAELDGDSGLVSVSTPYGTARSVEQFTYTEPPVIIGAGTRLIGKNTSLELSGLYFTGVLSVTIGGVPAKSFTVVSSNLINVVVGDGASGRIEVRTVNGVGTSPEPMIFVEKPEIHSFLPQKAGTGDSVTIFGKHLSYITNVKFGAFAHNGLLVLSDSAIKVVVGNVSSGDIIVSTVGGSDTIGQFIHAGPVIESFSSANGCFQAGVPVTIRGKNFLGTYKIDLGETVAASYTVVSDSLITAVPHLPISSIIRLATPAGSANFDLPHAKVDSISSNIGKEGDTLLIYGKRLCNTTSILFNGYVNANFHILSDSVVEVIVPAYGTRYIQMVFTTLPRWNFDFTHLGPYIYRVLPDGALSGSPITINGINFTNVSSVKIGSTPVSSYTVVSDEEITAITGRGRTGPLTVTTPNGTASTYFKVTDPFIDSIFPSSGKPGDTITLKGGFLNGVNTVQFGGTNAASFSVTPSMIKAVLGEGNSGPVYVSDGVGWGLYGNFEFSRTLYLCPGTTTTIAAGRTGSIYKWQVNNGSGFQSIADTGIYSGTNTSTLQVTGISSEYYGYRYRCLVDAMFGDDFTLKFKNSWAGTNSPSWENSGNWECGTIPDQHSDVVISTGNVVITSNVTIRSLTLSPGVNVTVTPGYTLVITH